MRVSVNFERKHFFIVLSIIVFVVLAGVVYSYGTGGPPADSGHDFAELEGIQAEITNGLTACSQPDRSIKTINPTTGAVTCEVDNGGVGGNSVMILDIVDGVEGSPPGGFTPPACPAGWTHLEGPISDDFHVYAGCDIGGCRVNRRRICYNTNNACQVMQIRTLGGNEGAPSPLTPPACPAGWTNYPLAGDSYISYADCLNSGPCKLHSTRTCYKC